MKAILLAMTMLFSGAAFAGEFTSFGRIHFQSASTWVPANKVCHAGGVYYHTKKAAVAVEYCNGEGNSNCHTVMKPLAQPMKSTRKVCTQWTGRDDNNCVATRTVAYNQGPTVKVEIFRSQHDMEEGHSPASVRSYTIPACRTAGPVPAL